MSAHGDTVISSPPGKLRTKIEKAGRRVAEPDLRVAAIALTRDAALVTADVKHFAGIGELGVENRLIDAD